nr:hypothetical protein [uncultured Rhodopila sp.]
MPTWIAGGLLLLCLALPVIAAEPTFADLLAKAEAESAAGRRWEPPGDNLADTVIALFQLAPAATSQQLAAFSALLERDRKAQQQLMQQLQQQQVPAVAPPAAEPPSAGLVAPPTAPPAPPPAPEPPSANLEPPSAVIPAPPPAPPRPVVRLPDAHAAELLARGQDAERSGDISGARRFYASAAERGNAVAARDLGRLYDPAYLGRTVIGGIDADPAAARHWYQRAAELGDREAAPLLQALSAR